MVIPKQWLIHSVQYEEYIGKDNWNNDVFAEPIYIDFVRVDLSTQFSRDSNQTKILSDAIMFVSPKHSRPAIEYKEMSKITFDGDVYTISKIVTGYWHNKNRVSHYEIELI